MPAPAGLPQNGGNAPATARVRDMADFLNLSAPIPRLKFRARRLARAEGIALHQALDRIARAEGFASWSLLAARAARAERSAPGAALSPAQLLAQMQPGELVLLAARPGQGKTRLGLALLAEALRAGRPGAFFTLEYAEPAAWDRLRAFGLSVEDREAGRLILETSEDIAAGWIAARLAGIAPGALVLVDYLQLLDQRRDKPPLAEQLAVLAGFARQSGAVVALISQVDRVYDPARQSLPGPADLRLPNPVDLSLVSRFCFLQGGACALVAA